MQKYFEKKNNCLSNLFLTSNSGDTILNYRNIELSMMSL